MNVHHNPEVRAKQQTLAFGDVELVQVIGHASLEAWIAEGQCAGQPETITTASKFTSLVVIVLVMKWHVKTARPAPFQIKAEQGAALQKIPGGAHQHIAQIFGAEGGALDKADACRRYFVFPTELWITVAGHRGAVRDHDLAADFAAWMSQRMQIRVGTSLAHALDQLRNCVGKTRHGDHVGIRQGSLGNQVSWLIAVRAGLEQEG